MRRAVLDLNVYISALLSGEGTPAELLKGWLRGDFELVVSDMLISELERVLIYPKILARISREEGLEFIDLIKRRAITAEDQSGPPPVPSPDPDDAYLITLASSERCVLVTGDGHLLGLADQIPVYTPAGFLKLIS